MMKFKQDILLQMFLIISLVYVFCFLRFQKRNFVYVKNIMGIYTLHTAPAASAFGMGFDFFI